MDAAPGAPAIMFGDITRAELTKILTDPTTRLAFAAALVVNTALFALSGADVVRLASANGSVQLSDIGVVMFAPVYLFLVIPVYAAGGEYGSGQYRVTLAAVPDRTRLVLAKSAALAAAVVPAAVAALLPGRLLLAAGHGLGPVATLLDVTRWTIAYVLMSCVAYGMAHLFRSRIVPLAILTLVPLLLATGVFPWPAVIRLLPDQLSLSLLGTPGFDVTELPAGLAAILLTCWAVTLLVAHAVATHVRDS